MENVAKEKIINALKHVSLNKQEIKSIDDDIDIFAKSEDDIEVAFAQQFVNNGGQFIFCETNNDLIENLKLAAKEYNWKEIYCKNKTLQQILNSAQIKYYENINDKISLNVGITLCESLISQHGSIMLSSAYDKCEQISSYSETLIILATINQIVPDFKTALSFMQEKYSNKLPNYITITSGPSKTTAIENNITNSAQGIKSIYLFLLEE